MIQVVRRSPESAIVRGTRSAYFPVLKENRGIRCAATRVRANEPRYPVSGTVSGRQPTEHTLRIGYARVSTREQNPNGQADVLQANGCERLFVEHASGKHKSRPELDRALAPFSE
jgi:hypothetical protein